MIWPTWKLQQEILRGNNQRTIRLCNEVTLTQRRSSYGDEAQRLSRWSTKELTQGRKGERPRIQNRCGTGAGQSWSRDLRPHWSCNISCTEEAEQLHQHASGGSVKEIMAYLHWLHTPWKQTVASFYHGSFIQGHYFMEQPPTITLSSFLFKFEDDQDAILESLFSDFLLCWIKPGWNMWTWSFSSTGQPWGTPLVAKPG